MSIYDEHSECHPCEDYHTLINEGVVLFDKKLYPEALKRFWSAFYQRPQSSIALYNLGRIMEELKDPNAEHFYKAAVIQGNADASFQLALMYLEAGNTIEAINHLKVYLKATNNKEDQWAVWARTTLDELCPKIKLVRKNGKKV